MLQLNRYTSLLTPQSCTFCRSATSGQSTPVCHQCHAELPRATERGQTLGELSAFYYEPPISQYILAGKTGKQLDKLKILAELLADNLIPLITTPPEAIIPIPLHTKRLRQRGFNQSIELALPLAKRLGVPLLTQDIVRQRDTREQKQLSAAQRAKNMHAAFKLSATLPYQHVAIFDDVITTGTTCAVLRQQLLTQGIESVEIWCCATTKQ